MNDRHIPATPGQRHPEYKYEPYSIPENFTEDIAGVAPYLQAGGLLSLLGGAGLYNYGEGKLRSAGRQALAEIAAKKIAAKYNLPNSWVENNLAGRQVPLPDLEGPFRTSADIPRLPEGGMGGIWHEIDARRAGNSLFNIFSRAGRQAGQRARDLEMDDLIDLYKFAIGTEQSPGQLPTTIASRQKAFDEAAAAYAADRATAPMPGRKPNQYVPEVDLSQPLTRAGAQRAAGEIVLGSRPGMLPSSIFGRAATQARGMLGAIQPAMSRAGLISSIASPIIGFAAQHAIPYFLANKEEAEIKKRGDDAANITDSMAKQRVQPVSKVAMTGDQFKTTMNKYWSDVGVLDRSTRKMIIPNDIPQLNRVKLALDKSYDYISRMEMQGADPKTVAKSREVLGEMIKIIEAKIKATPPK